MSRDKGMNIEKFKNDMKEHEQKLAQMSFKIDLYDALQDANETIVFHQLLDEVELLPCELANGLIVGFILWLQYTDYRRMTRCEFINCLREDGGGMGQIPGVVKESAPSRCFETQPYDIQISHQWQYVIIRINGLQLRELRTITEENKIANNLLTD
ncbi:hypothetical protein ACFLVF_00085 [Chloroflexota bacterium]